MLKYKIIWAKSIVLPSGMNQELSQKLYLCLMYVDYMYIITKFEDLCFLQEQKVNITRIQDLRLNPDFKYTPLKVQYKCNYVEFVSTSAQEAKLKSKLQATGLAVDVKPYDLDDLQGADDPVSSPRPGPGCASKPCDIELFTV